MESVCVHTSTCLRLSLSTQTPANGATRNVGIWPAKLTVPNSSAEPVSRYTSHDVAMRVIQVPISEMVWPPKNSLKLRCRSARHTCEAPLVARTSVWALWPCASATSGPALIAESFRVSSDPKSLTLWLPSLLLLPPRQDFASIPRAHCDGCADNPRSYKKSRLFRLRLPRPEF